MPASVLISATMKKQLMAVMIGIDPHKASHTAVALDDSELFLGELRVRSAADQLERLLGWAAGFGERTWAIEGAGGLGYLLAQQLVAAGERVVDVQPKLAARVRLLATGDSNKNDPNDARSVAVAALRSCDLRVVQAEDHAAVMKMWAKRHRDLARQHTRVACRLHAVLCDLVAGGIAGEISPAQATDLLDDIEPQGAVAAADTSSPASSSPTWSASMSSAARPADGSPPRSPPPRRR